LIAASESSSLVGLKLGRVVALLGGGKKEAPELERLGKRLQVLGKETEGVSVSVGIGRYVSAPGGLSQSYRQALVALEAGEELRGPGSLLHFDKSGSYELLLHMWEARPEEILSLYEETLGPLDRYDQEHRTQLVETLVTYFRHNENLTETAKVLYAHVHTIRYRLAKIAEIFGESALAVERRQQLGLGLKARCLLEALQGSGSHQGVGLSHAAR
jgi:sugar diacid utilization regulator